MGLSGSKNNVVPVETNSKKALLIGVNYRGSLRGSHNDVKIMNQCLVQQFGFQKENITLLLDTGTSETQPTGHNIRLELDKLVGSAKPRNIIFVHFSGHGYRKRSKAKDDDTGYDEYIIAADGERITDDDFRKYVNQLPKDCRITMLADCCHSGGMIEAAKEQIGDSTKERRQYSRADVETINVSPEDNGYVGYRTSSPSGLQGATILKFWSSPKPYCSSKSGHVSLFHGQFSVPLRFWGYLKPQFKTLTRTENFKPSMSSPPDGGILLSACQSYQKAQEREFSGTVYGVFTKAIVTVIEETGGVVTNRDLVLKAREILDRLEGLQDPGLYCSDPHADALFLC